MSGVPESELSGIPHLAEQRVYFDTLRALKRNKRIPVADARRFAYEASKNARKAAARSTNKPKGGE